ncbi:MAG: DUF423 domain-containing protein, partial [Myxococcota bacterium]
GKIPSLDDIDKGLATIGRPRHLTFMAKVFVVAGAVSGLIGIALGAFGAHGLKARLTEELLAIFETGARYQMYHALALVFVGLAAQIKPHGAFQTAGWLWIIGTFLFSGSLYALALSGVRVLGAITPLGGLAFIAGWACLAWGAFKAMD